MNGMNEDIGKRIIAFTSQSLKEYGIHAVRMNDIARNMSMSKRTIYEIYASKENLIYLCLQHTKTGQWTDSKLSDAVLLTI